MPASESLTDAFDTCRSCLPKMPGTIDIAKRVHFVGAPSRPMRLPLFYARLYEHAAMLVIDGIGEDTTAWLGCGTPEGMRAIDGDRLSAFDRDAVGTHRRLFGIHRVTTPARDHGACSLRRPGPILCAVQSSLRRERNSGSPRRLDRVRHRSGAGAVSRRRCLRPRIAVRTETPLRRSELLDDCRFADVAAGLQTPEPEDAMLELCSPVSHLRPVQRRTSPTAAASR